MELNSLGRIGKLMIKIENTEVFGWDSAIQGMRNPLNSWDKSDSIHGTLYKLYDGTKITTKDGFSIGENDLKLMHKLSAAGNDHSKFLRMVIVYADIVAPLYWWKEFDTYKVGTVRNSCSTMHKIHSKEFTLDDFSHEHIYSSGYASRNILEHTIEVLNLYREDYLVTKKKDDWWQMIQLLPSSYNQRATVMLNYQVLKNIYHSRKHHKLDEWVFLCDWIESLPYSEIITGKGCE